MKRLILFVAMLACFTAPAQEVLRYGADLEGGVPYVYDDPDAPGKLVGEATGGNQRGGNGGAFFFVRLPASGIEFDLPLIGNFPMQPAPDAGIEPDLKVDVAAVDIATGIDAQMERALALATGS